MDLNNDLQELTEQINDLQENNELRVQEIISFSHLERIHHKQTLEEHSGAVWSLATFVQHGKKYFVSGSYDKTLKIWDGAEHRCETSNIISSLDTYNVGGHNYVACSGDYEIEIWNIETKQCVKNIEGHTSGIYSLLAFELNGKKYLASGSDDNIIKIWDLLTYNCIATLTGHSRHVVNMIGLTLL